jgi:hypothetical protein
MQHRGFLFFLFMVMILGLVTGFNIDNAIVPENDILSGGPPKDGIPALLEPKFVPAPNVDYLNPDDQVIGVVIGKEARAYPIKILNWHEAVNDTLNERPLVVTF